MLTDGSPAELRRRHANAVVVTIKVAAGPAAGVVAAEVERRVRSAVAPAEVTLREASGDAAITLHIPREGGGGSASAAGIVRAVVAAGEAVEDFVVGDTTLEDVMLALYDTPGGGK